MHIASPGEIKRKIEASFSPKIDYIRIPSVGIQASVFLKSFPNDSNVYAVLSTIVV